MHAGSMAGIFFSARLLLPRHPVGITSSAVPFLIRLENMLLIIFFVLSSLYSKTHWHFCGQAEFPETQAAYL